jgi:hypothetical protein
MEMIERFPALNGPYGLDIRRGQRDRRASDYNIGYFLIYVAIWFDKHAAYERAHQLAGKHHLGLFEASSPDGEIWLPGVGDELVLASSMSTGLGTQGQLPTRELKRLSDHITVVTLCAHCGPRRKSGNDRECRLQQDLA